MKTLRLIAVAFALALAAGCTDLPTDTTPPTAEEARGGHIGSDG